MITPDELRAVPLLAGLEEEDYEFLISISEERLYAPGQAIAAQGAPADAMWIMLEGDFQYMQEGVADPRVFVGEPGEVTGLLPFSRMTHYTGAIRALTPTRGARVGREHFAEMLRRIPVLEGRLIGALTDRVRETTRSEEQREKLMALGRLSAGLAHEMNNPAAALRRGTSHLRERLRVLPERTVSLAGCNLSVAQFSTLAAMQTRKTSGGRPPRLPPLEASAREEALGEWLEGHGVKEAWTLAETFVASGVETAELDELAASLPEVAVRDALAWLGGGLEAELLLREMEDAATRIAELVASVKSYSHMDETHTRAETDLHEGLESTLTMLSYKIGEKNARIVRDYDSSLPHLWANAGELNQVWTNLIDNALDAMPENGATLEIAARHEGHFVKVDIIDNGNGIPNE
ncbi:MAG: cyclic nucleotide-binding domain-containing protein, partial [Gemmatimonadetes bacterium]|nr:cyclic nucleotide-binding domain-containing protein [Gemmatimonadota bacterium]